MEKDRPLSSRERQHLAQLVICSSAFVLLVAAKLLLPEKMAEVNLQLSGALEQNMDVQSVFRAVGRAFSGEEDVEQAAEDVYRAVFQPEEEAVETAAPAALEADLASALDALQMCRFTPSEEPSPVSLAYVLYSEQNLPESVSLEQSLLGFDYCSPLPGATLSSGFGYRDHPTAGEERFHYGIDLAADTGTAVVCFADGKVKAVGESSSYGKYCMVDHEGGYSTLYAHCSRITVSSGAEVTEGEKIAEVGETGMATGPHLHFELQREGEYLNPIYYVSPL
jgi:murein DD-endopeptidase MepM/ murein hydrolase activator NlpD